MFLKKYRKAFTLVELIIGLAVIGTMASFSTVSYVGYKDMADKEHEKLDIQQVKNAVDNFYTANLKYPTLPISKQPTPDVKDSSGNIIFEGYSKVDVNSLVEKRYLQEVPKLKKGQYFAVNFNGVVTVRDDYSESVVVNKGNTLVETQPNNLVEFDVYTAPNASEIKIYETNSDYIVSGSGFNFKTKAPTKAEEYDLYTGKVAVSASQGQKYFVVKIRYKDNSSVELRTSFQYALSSDTADKNQDVYWINKRVSNPHDEQYRTSAYQGKYTVVTTTDTSIMINWTNEELATGASAIRYEIRKYNSKTGNSNSFTETIDSPIITGNTEYVDTLVRGNEYYRYEIYAYTASKNDDGTNKKTTNYIVTPNTTKTKPYTDTAGIIENITKNDYNTAYNKAVNVRAGDLDDGVKSVFLVTAKVEDGIVGEFKRYEMEKTKDPSTTALINNKQVKTDIYSYPIEVEDDYMLYYIEMVDNKGYSTYCYMNGNLTKSTSESEADFEKRRHTVSKTLPNNVPENCYTLMRGLVEIHNDSFADDSKIEKNNTYHLYDGKITLP